MNQDIVDKFSTHLKTVLTRALCYVVETNQKNIKPIHLLWALGTQKGCIGSEILKKSGVEAKALRALIGETTITPTLEIADGHFLQLSDEAKRVLEKAVLCAHVYSHKYVGTEHLLSGLLQAGGKDVLQFFETHSVDTTQIKDQVSFVLKSTTKLPELHNAFDAKEEKQEESEKSLEETSKDKKTPALDYFGNDLTSEEAQAKIDRIIGREAEIERVMEILCRRTKNNPLLIGEPGVGKTAIAEGLAKKIFEGDVPSILQDRRVVNIDLSLVIAGTMYRGEFEARLRQIIDEAKADPNIILFIDEVHTLVGAGASSGSLDAANILKPALARGDIHCIGATTLDEFKKHIENDSALERRFQSIIVEEPSIDKTIEILQGIAPYFEDFHRVRISQDALESAAELAERYIPHKHFPDKAIDLIDEAAASIRVRSRSLGTDDERRLLEQRLKSLTREKREAVIEERFLDAINYKKEEEQINNALGIVKEYADEPEHVLDSKDIARVISKMTSIPHDDILLEERERFSNLDAQLTNHVLGQDHIIERVTHAILRAKTGISHPHKPLASFLFLGPSGVGKTELARALSKELFRNESSLIRLDMSEFSEGFTMSKLIGAPAGYVGYKDHAQLTDKVKQKPYCVVLFDEIEKAHPDVRNILLQILEEGEVQDASGKKISFRNTIIVMTSNIGLERFEKGGIGFSHSLQADRSQLEADILEELKQRFRPELLNRIDNTLLFNPLDQKALKNIVKKQLKELIARLEKRGVELSFEKGLNEFLVSSIDSTFGARDLRRRIQDTIEQEIAKKFVKGRKPKRLAVRVKNGKLSVIHAR